MVRGFLFYFFIILIPCFIQISRIKSIKRRLPFDWQTQFYKHGYGIVEIHVISGVIIEIGLIFWLWGYSHYGSCITFIIFFTIFLSLRLIEIIWAWAHVYISPAGFIKSPLRTFILTGINYFEIVFIFAVISFFFKHDFHPQLDSIAQSLRYSIGIMTTMGSNFEPYHWRGYLLFFFEIGFGLLFLVFIIQRAVSFFHARN